MKEDTYKKGKKNIENANLEDYAKAARTFTSVSYTHLTLPTKRIV